MWLCITKTHTKVQPEDIHQVPALMVRERVDIHGQVRSMEPQEDIPALCVKPHTVGVIKEGPVRRWYEGQSEADRKFERTAQRIVKRRKKVEDHVERMLQEAREAGFVLAHENSGGQDQGEMNGSTQGEPSEPRRKAIVRVSSGQSGMSTNTASSSVRIDEHRRYGPLDLVGEKPPPSAIAGRRDTASLFLSLMSIPADSAACSLRRLH